LSGFIRNGYFVGNHLNNALNIYVTHGSLSTTRLCIQTEHKYLSDAPNNVPFKLATNFQVQTDDEYLDDALKILRLN